MINIIAAVAKNGVIGKNGRLPWSLDKDMARFKKLTVPHTVIMGANTYREIGRPLPQRFNIIVSSTLEIQAENAAVVSSLAAALDCARNRNTSEIFILGGEKLFQEAIAFADRLYITHIDADFDGDVFFPAIPDCYELVKTTAEVDGKFNTRFCKYVRKPLQ